MSNKKKNSNYVTEKTVQAKADKENERRAARRKELTKKIAIPTVAVLLIVGLVVGLGFAFDWWNNNPNKNLTVTHYATITVKDYGSVKLALYGEEAPETVENFVFLAESGFYNGLTFHRIMKGFMAQGGDPDANGTGGSGLTIKGEFSANGVENNVKHVRGTISMARSDDYNAASSQFFIVHETSKDNSAALDGNYAAFGMAVDGMQVIDKICADAKPTNNNGAIAANDQPVIESITIEKVEN